jgi:hypothetical protein
VCFPEGSSTRAANTSILAALNQIRLGQLARARNADRARKGPALRIYRAVQDLATMIVVQC